MQAKQLPWSDAVAQKLSKAMGNDQALFEREVNANVCQIWELLGGDLYMITRSEYSELVICAMEGKGMSKVAPEIIKHAKQRGFKSIRFHTQQIWLAEKLAKFGFKEQERIYSVEL